LRRTERLGPWRSFPGQRGYLRQSFGPGWALVGDAAHFKDPIGAHGMTDALRDAELLARAASAVLADGADEHRALAAYQDQRDALSLRFFAAVERIASYRWDLHSLPALMIELSKAMGAEAEAMVALGTQTEVAA
jgi:2-polyprenyl-6-methoxyphenol hydroxylase-like FAD-dependent oxidoreductase